MSISKSTVYPSELRRHVRFESTRGVGGPDDCDAGGLAGFRGTFVRKVRPNLTYSLWNVRMKRFPLLLIFLTACLFGDSLGPSEADALGPHLSMTVLPETVISGEEFTARVTVTNPTADTVLMRGSGCLTFLAVYVGDERQDDFDGTVDACTEILIAYPVPPFGSIISERDLRAGIQNQPGRPGTYKLRADFTVTPELPRLEHLFVVR